MALFQFLAKNTAAVFCPRSTTFALGRRPILESFSPGVEKNLPGQEPIRALIYVDEEGAVEPRGIPREMLRGNNGRRRQGAVREFVNRIREEAGHFYDFRRRCVCLKQKYEPCQGSGEALHPRLTVSIVYHCRASARRRAN